MCGGGFVDVASVFIIILMDELVLARERKWQVTPEMSLRHE